MGRQLGVKEAQLTDLAEYETSAAFSPLERAVLRLADGMTRTPVEVPQSVFDELRASLDEGQLVELVTTIAWENWRSRFNRAFAIAPEGFSEGAVCAVPARLAAQHHPAG